MHLVEHLLLDGLQVDAPAGAGDLADHGAAIGLDLGDREGQVPRLGHVLVARIAEIAAGHLRAAFQQMPDGAAARQQRHVLRMVIAPAKGVDHRREEQRRVGNAPGNDDLGALLQRLHDWQCPFVRLGRYQRVAQRAHMGAALQQVQVLVADGAGQVGGGDGGDLHTGQAQFLAQLRNAARGTERVDPALVADDARAVGDAMRQHGAHAFIEVGIVAGKGGVAPAPYLRGADGGLCHGLEAQVVEAAFARAERRGFDAVAPPAGAGADAQRGS
ncbi:hypothetical protein D9M72_429320 [compost metagenome]